MSKILQKICYTNDTNCEFRSNVMKKKIMNTKYVLNEYFCYDFNIRVFVLCCTNCVMTFFVKFVNYRANNNMIVNVKQFRNKINRYIDSTLQNYDQ